MSEQEQELNSPESELESIETVVEQEKPPQEDMLAMMGVYEPIEKAELPPDADTVDEIPLDENGQPLEEGTQDAEVPNELEALRAELAELKAKLENPQKEVEEPKKPLVEEKDGTFQFLTDEDDPYQLTNSKEGLNLFGTRVTNAAVELALRHAMPVIQAETARIQAIYSFSSEFYRANPDLRAEAATVSAVIEDMLRENADIKPRDLFEQAGKEARKRLRLPDPKQPPQKAQKPAALPSVAASVAQRKTSGTEADSLRDELRLLAKQR